MRPVSGTVGLTAVTESNPINLHRDGMTLCEGQFFCDQNLREAGGLCLTNSEIRTKISAEGGEKFSKYFFLIKQTSPKAVEKIEGIFKK